MLVFNYKSIKMKLTFQPFVIVPDLLIKLIEINDSRTNLIPGVPENGTVDNDKYTAGATLRFSCDEGYKLSGFDEITCLSTELWNADVLACKGIS